MKAALIYVADPLGLYNDGWGCQVNNPAQLLHQVLKPNHSLTPPHHPSIRLLAPLDTSSCL
jgi:hypothetical protein